MKRSLMWVIYFLFLIPLYTGENQQVPNITVWNSGTSQNQNQQQNEPQQQNQNGDPSTSAWSIGANTSYQSPSTQGWSMGSSSQNQSGDPSTSAWQIGSNQNQSGDPSTSAWSTSSNTSHQSPSTQQWSTQQTNPKQQVTTKIWTVTSGAEMTTTIYNTNAYYEVTQSLYSIQERMSQIMNFFQQETLSQSTSWFANGEATKGELAKYQDYFTQYLNAFAGKQNSYISAVRQTFQGYQSLPSIYQKKIQQQKQTMDNNVFLYFAKMPFQSGSFGLELVQEAVGSVLNYIQMRMALISIETYGSPLTEAFLVGTVGTPSHFAQLHHSVDLLEGICESNFNALKRVPGITRAELVQFQNNYKSIFTSYEEETCKLVISFTLKLLKQVTTQYPIDLAIHANVTTMSVNLPVLKELYATCKSGLEVLSEIAKTKEKENPQNAKKEQTYFGIYNSPQGVLEALGGMMGEILAFAGTVEQNLIKEQIKEKNLTSNAPAIQKAISTASLLFLQAAGCFYDAQNMTNYNAYGDIGKALSMTAQAWVKAQRNNKSGTYGYAAEQYQIAYEAAQQTGNNDLAFLLMRYFNMAMLNYAQYSLNQYTSFGQYQSDIVNYIESAGTVPQGIQDSKESLIQNLFYSQGSTAFKGIAGLCSEVAETYKANLSSLQATKYSMQNNEKLLLQNGITVTQNISDAAQAMLVGTPATETEQAYPAADKSMYVDYYAPSSVFYGQQRYLDVFHSFELADKAMAQAPNNKFASFGKLFQNSPIKTFGGFAQLHFTRICLMSALEAQSYSTNPKYAYYKNDCIVSSFFSFLSAYKVYRVLGRYPQLVKYCTQNLEEFRPVLSVILQDAQSRISNAKATQLDYQMALVELQGATILGNQNAFELYQKVLEQYVENARKGVFGIQFPGLLQSYAYYQAYLMSLYVHNQENAQMYQQKIEQSLQILMQEIEQATNAVKNSNASFDKRIAIQKQLQSLQKTVEQYSITQRYEQALFGITNNDFCRVQEGYEKGVPQIEIIFMGGTKTVLLNPLFQLANLYVLESNTMLNQIEQNFNSSSPNYGLLTTAHFKKLMGNYKTALMSFGQLGLQNQVMQVEQGMTKLAAFRYFSAVVPSDTVTQQISISKTAIVNTGTQAFQSSGKVSQNGTAAWTISPNQNQNGVATSAWNIAYNQNQEGQTTASGSSSQDNSNEPQKQVKKPSILPYYLLADWQVNISKLAQNANNIAQEAKASAPEGARIPPAMSNKQELYSQILSIAQKLMGKKDVLEDIVKYVAIPLFQDELERGGYQGVFRTLKQEVELYYDQLSYLMYHGMPVGNSTLKANLHIMTVPDPTTGESDVVLRGVNIPLAPIPRYQGDTNCAVFYYSLYQKFFNQTGQPVDVEGNIFFPITGQEAKTLGERAEREIDRAYLASALQYKHKIMYLIAPLQEMSSKDRLNADFQKYSTMYTQLNKAYQWQVSLIQAIGMLQKKAGLGYINVNKKSSEVYQDWAKNSQLFLFGMPFTASYLQVLNNIQGYYDLAAQAIKDPTTQSSLYRHAAQLNINAAEMCAQTKQMTPQVGGYPSTSPAGYPSSSVSVSDKDLQTLKCSAPAPSYALPQSGEISWRYYEDAQMHYGEALKLYKKALAAENPHDKAGGFLNDNMVRTLTGLSMKNHLLASLQRVALVGRNTWIVKVQEKNHVSAFSTNPNPVFNKIRADGASGGAISAIQGEQSLVSGSGQQSSGNAVSQYELIKKLLLDGIIYLTPLIGTTATLMKELPTVPIEEQKTTVNNITGRSIICSAMHNYPNLGAPVPTDKRAKSKDGKPIGPPILNVATFSNYPGVIGLGNFTQSTQLALPYADTFASFIEYIFSDLIGTFENDFDGLNNNLQVAALSNFVSQLNSLLTNLYKQTFLPELMKNQNSSGTIEKAETSFQTALKACQQKMLVNATSYLG